MTTKIWVNGVKSTAVLSVDRALSFGDGVFETLLLVNGKAPLIHYHLARLKEGLQRLKIECDLSSLFTHLSAIIDELSADTSDRHLLKLIVSRGASDFGYSVKGLQARFTVISKPFLDTSNHALHLIECSTTLADQPLLAGIKHCNRLEQILAKQEVESFSSKVDDGIVLDVHKQVIETTCANIFLIEGQQLITPKLDRCGVAGVMRAYIIQDISHRLGLTVNEEDVSLARFYQADGVFISNAVTGVRPVISCREKQWPIHALYQQIDASIQQLWDVE